jgi:hypothetical protein
MHCLILDCFVKSYLANTSKGYAFVHIEVRQDGVVIDLDQGETLCLPKVPHQKQAFDLSKINNHTNLANKPYPKLT